jgi:hypothetical protein
MGSFNAPAYEVRITSMSKVLAIHLIEPHPGVSIEDFEQRVLEVLRGVPVFDGWKTYVLKGDRGERKGQYLLVHEFDSIEIRNRYFPNEDGSAAEEVRLSRHRPDLDEKWYATVRTTPYTPYTDYIELGG